MQISLGVVCAFSLTAAAFGHTDPSVRTDAAGNAARTMAAPTALTDPTSHTIDRGTPAWVPFGPGGGDVRAIASSPTAAGVVIAGLQNSFGGGALYRSTNSGGSWTALPDTGTRGINEVEFASNGTGYAATSDGLYKTVNDGATWTRLTLPTGPATLVTDVTIAPNDPNTVWIGMGQYLDNSQTQFVLRSTDAGLNWTNLSPPAPADKGVTVLAVDPANPMHIFAAFAGNFGAGGQLWVSENGGTMWADRTSNLPNNIFWDIAFAGSTVYIVGGQDFGGQFVGLYSSTDVGMFWNEQSANWPSRSVTAIAVNPANPMNILVGTQRAGLGRTTDGGANWSFSVGGTREFPVNDIDFGPGGNVYLGIGSVAVFKSTDSGATFAPSGSGIRNLNVSSIAVNPLNANEIALAYVGDNDGGIFTSIDGGQNWALSSAPLPRWQKVVFGPDGLLYATHDGPLGRADDGVWARNTGGTWVDLGPGDPGTLDTQGHDIAISRTTPQVILFGGQEGFFGGFDAVLWSYNLGGIPTWVKQYEGMIPSEEVESVLFLNNGMGPVAVASIVNFGQEDGAAGGILRSPDMGDTWARSETGYPTAWHGWQLANRPSEPNTVYVSSSQNTGTMPAGVYKSTDGGQSWMAQGTSNPTFRSFLADPQRPMTLYGLEVFSGRVYRSTNDGATFSLFDNGLPGMGGSRIAYGGGSQPHLYLATGSGAFVTPLAAACAGDFNNSGSVSVQDIFDFLTAYFSNAPAADVNHSGSVSVQDIFDFLTAYFTPCT